MHRQADDPAERLRWSIRCGKQLDARDAAKELDWQQAKRQLLLSGAPWERGATYDAIAAAGSTITEADLEALIGEVLEAAADHSTNEGRHVNAPAAAQRALATVLCALEPVQINQACDEVLYEINTSPFPPRETLAGLLLAAQLGQVNQAPLIAGVFSLHDRMHVPGFDAALKIIDESDEAKAIIVQDSARHVAPLLVAAWLDLPDAHPELADRAADLIAKSQKRLR